MKHRSRAGRDATKVAFISMSILMMLLPMIFPITEQPKYEEEKKPDQDNTFTGNEVSSSTVVPGITLHSPATKVSDTWISVSGLYQEDSMNPEKYTRATDTTILGAPLSLFGWLDEPYWSSPVIKEFKVGRTIGVSEHHDRYREGLFTDVGYTTGPYISVVAYKMTSGGTTVGSPTSVTIYGGPGAGPIDLCVPIADTYGCYRSDPVDPTATWVYVLEYSLGVNGNMQTFAIYILTPFDLKTILNPIFKLKSNADGTHSRFETDKIDLGAKYHGVYLPSLEKATEIARNDNLTSFSIGVRIWQYGADGLGTRTVVTDPNSLMTQGFSVFEIGGSASGGYRYISIEYTTTYLDPATLRQVPYGDGELFTRTGTGTANGQFVRLLAPPDHTGKTHTYQYRLCLYPHYPSNFRRYKSDFSSQGHTSLEMGSIFFEIPKDTVIDLGRIPWIASDDGIQRFVKEENWAEVDPFMKAYSSSVAGIPGRVSVMKVGTEIQFTLKVDASIYLNTDPVPYIDFTFYASRKLTSYDYINQAFLNLYYVTIPSGSNYQVSIFYTLMPVLAPFWEGPSLPGGSTFPYYIIYRKVGGTWDLINPIEQVLDRMDLTGTGRKVDVILNSGIHDFKFLVRMGSTNSPPYFKEIFFSVDTSKGIPSGSWGTDPIQVSSPDMNVDAGSAYDKDGTFSITAIVSGIIDTTSYDVRCSRYDGISLTWGSSSILKNIPYAGGGLVSFTITMSEMASLFFLPNGAGSYRYSLTPKSDAGIVGSLCWGDVASENAIAITGSGSYPISQYVQVTIIDFKKPTIRFKAGNNILPDTFTSQTGIPDIEAVGFVDLPYFSANKIKYYQYEGLSLVYDDFGFYDMNNRLVHIDLDKDLASLETYTSYPSNTIVGRMQSLVGYGSGVQQLKRVVDGTYSFDMVYDYNYFGFSDLSNRLTMTIDSKRPMLSGTTITSNNGQFSLSWETFDFTPPNNVYNSYVNPIETKYIVIYAKQGDAYPADFNSNLGSLLTSKFHVLSWYDEEDTTWVPRVYDSLSGGTTGIIDGSSGKWGSIDGVCFDEDDAVYYMAVVPFYMARKLYNTGIGSQYVGVWYHGEISDVTQVNIAKAITSTVSITPSKAGVPRKIYTQSTVSIVGSASTILGGYYPDSAKFFFKDSSGTITLYDTPMTKSGNDFTLTTSVFNLIGKNTEKTGKFVVNFSFESVSHDLFHVNTIDVKIITGIMGVVDFISPGNYSTVRPTSTTMTEFLFSMKAITNPSLLAYGLSNYNVESTDITLSSISIGKLSIGIGTAGVDGRVDRLSDGYTWKLVLNNVFDLYAGLVVIKVNGNVDDGNIQVGISGNLVFFFNPVWNFIVTSPRSPDVNGLIEIDGYSPFTVKWLTYFGTGIQPDSVKLTVVRAIGGSYQNGEIIFSGSISPSIYTYIYSMNPLNYGMNEHFSFLIESYKGKSIFAPISFEISIDFDVFIHVDPSDFNYNSNNPQLNGDIKAWIDFKYPVSYYWYVLDMGEPIDRPELYWIERNEGGSVTIIRPEGLGRGSPDYLPFDLTGFVPSAGLSDKMYFYIKGPNLVKVDWDLLDEGKTFQENLSLVSTSYFTSINVSYTPSYIGMEYTEDSIWEITVDGNPVTFTLNKNTNKIWFIISSIRPGQSIPIKATFYSNGKPQPPSPQPTDIWSVILAFILSIIAAIMAIFGLSIHLKKRNQGIMTPF